MIPIWPILFVALRAARAGGLAKPARVTVGSERIIAVAIWATVWPLVVSFLGVLWASEGLLLRLLTVVAAAAVSLLAFPWPWARFVFIPLGRVKAAARVTRLSLWAWGGDREGGAVVAGALAVARRPASDAARREALAWLDARVTRAKVAHGALLLGQSLLARLRADHARADRLLAAVAFLPGEIVPVPARALAGEAFVGDALARGDLRRAARAHASGSVHAALLAACARALTAPPPPPPAASLGGRIRGVAQRARRARRRGRIVWLALRARPRSAWTRLVDDALAALRVSPGEAAARAPVVPRARTSDPVGAALDADADAGLDATVQARVDTAGLTPPQAAMLWAAHARRRGVALDDDELAALGEALDDAAFSLTHEADTDVALVDAATDAMVDVVRAVAWPPVRKATVSSTLARLDDDSGALDALYAVCERLPRSEPLPPAAELEEWALLRLLYEDALADAGADDAMAPWEALRDPVWNHGARIFNAGQKGVGRAMFRFLLDEAARRGDDNAVKGMKKNLRAA